MLETEDMYVLHRVKVNIIGNCDVKVKDQPLFYNGNVVSNPFTFTMTVLEDCTIENISLGLIMDEIIPLKYSLDPNVRPIDVNFNVEFNGFTND